MPEEGIYYLLSASLSRARFVSIECIIDEKNYFHLSIRWDYNCLLFN